VDLIHLAQDKVQWRQLMNLPFHEGRGNASKAQRLSVSHPMKLLSYYANTQSYWKVAILLISFKSTHAFCLARYLLQTDMTSLYWMAILIFIPSERFV
jgi:hypothetical protein